MKESVVISDTYRDEITRTAMALKLGKVILYPTDTVWGLGCDIRNRSAVARIREIKKREEKNPFIILVSSIEMLKEYVRLIHPRVETLLSYHVRPLTIIYRKVQNLPEHIIGPAGTVAIRVCKDSFCQSIINEFGHPIVSTSANVSGTEYPRSFSEIDPVIITESDYVVDYRQEEEVLNEVSILATYNYKGELEFIRE